MTYTACTVYKWRFSLFDDSLFNRYSVPQWIQERLSEIRNQYQHTRPPLSLGLQLQVKLLQIYNSSGSQSIKQAKVCYDIWFSHRFCSSLGIKFTGYIYNMNIIRNSLQQAFTAEAANRAGVAVEAGKQEKDQLSLDLCTTGLSKIGTSQRCEAPPIPLGPRPLPKFLRGVRAQFVRMMIETYSQFRNFKDLLYTGKKEGSKAHCAYTREANISQINSGDLAKGMVTAS